MSKIIKKLPIDDFWNIGKNESWFADMAAGGLHLKSFDRIFVNFEKGEPSNTKYRIDIFSKKPSQEQIDIYNDNGWSFVASTGMFYIFSSPENSDAPELHTDPEEQSYTLIGLNKLLKKNVIIISVSVLFIIIMILGLFIFYDEPYLLFINGDFIMPVFFSVLELYVLFTVIRNYIYVKRLKNSLMNGTPINHKENWKKGIITNRAINIILLIITLLGIAIPTIRMVKRDEYTLPETKNDLPIIRLAELEENPNLQRESRFYDDEIDSNNHVLYEWGILAPIHYNVYERGIVPEEMWNDLSGEYSPSIHTEFYQLKFEGMADGLINDLIHRNVYLPMAKLEKVENHYFNELYVVVEDSSKEVFASWNNNVIYIRYHGKSDTEHILNLLTKIVN